MTVSSHLHELKNSGIEDCDATSNPPPVGSGLEAGAQESPSTSNIKSEDGILPPDKGKGKVVPDDTAWGGLGHNPPRHQEKAYHPQRQNESADHLQSHSVHHYLTTRSDDEEILDGFLSKMDELEKDLDEAAAEAKRRAEEVHATTQSSLAEVCQCVKAWKEGCSQRDVETSCL